MVYAEPALKPIMAKCQHEDCKQPFRAKQEGEQECPTCARLVRLGLKPRLQDPSLN